MNIFASEADKKILFDGIVRELRKLFGLSATVASELLATYKARFSDVEYCQSIGVPVQDDDFFFHQAPMGMALMVYYYLVVKGDPDPQEFLKWRTGYLTQRRNT